MACHLLSGSILSFYGLCWTLCMVSGSPLQVSSVFAPAPLCANPLDIVLAIDSSGSMESTWNTTIDNAEILISHFQISKDRTRVSVIDYSAVTNMVMPLDANNTEQDVFRALETLRNIPQFGETWPELALDRASDIFSTANPRRNESRKLIVLFTDGEITSKDADSITGLMKNLKMNDIEVFLQECGNKSTPEPGIWLMASHPENVYGKSQQARYGQPRLEQALCYKSRKELGDPQYTPPTINALPGGNFENQSPSNNAPITHKPTESGKCEEVREKVLLDKVSKHFLPRCNAEGRFEALQYEPGTDIAWCVNQDTGEELYGTRIFGTKLDCPGNKDKSNAKTKCELEREKQARIAASIPDIFVPECSSVDGLYSQIQQSPWFAWCVNRYNGKMVNGTNRKHSLGLPVCAEPTGCELHQQRAVESNYVNGSNSSNRTFVPQCQESGLYHRLQFSLVDGHAWCVNEATGKEVNNTRNKGFGDSVPVCSNGIDDRCLMPPTLCPESNGQNTSQKYVFDTQTASCVSSPGKICGVKNTNEFSSLNDCEEVCGLVTKCMIDREFASLNQVDQQTNQAFEPKCDEDGFFEQQQSYSNGSSWCVDILTGKTIENTFVQNGSADCSKVPEHVQKDVPNCIAEREKASGTMLVGAYIPQCTDDGHYQQIQIHGSTGESWCVHNVTGIKIEGTEKSRIEGSAVCPSHPDIDCLLPKDSGLCLALFPRFFYDWRKNQCVQFNYGGCQGNANRFPNLHSCEKACLVRPAEHTIDEWKPIPQPEPEDWVRPQHSGNKTYPEPEYIPATDADDIFNPQHSCTEEHDFALQRKGSLQFVSVFVPECDERGDFRPLQRYGSTGEKWCVNTITGKLIAGTKRGPGQKDPECDNGSTSTMHEAAIANASAASLSNTTYATHVVSVAPGESGSFPSPPPISATHQSPPPLSPVPPSQTKSISTTPQTTQHFASSGTTTPIYSWDSMDATHVKKPEQMINEWKQPVHNRSYPEPTVPKNSTTQFLSWDSTNGTNETCEFVLGSNLVKLGCMRDSHQIPQPLPVEILNKSAEGYRVKDNQEHFSSFLKELVCECANLTRSKGWFTFGIQNYGVCYSGPDEGRYKEDGVADEEACISEQIKSCSMNDTLACTGVPRADSLTNQIEHANVVYMIKTKEHQAIHYIEYDRKKRAFKKLSRSVEEDLKNLHK